MFKVPDQKTKIDYLIRRRFPHVATMKRPKQSRGHLPALPDLEEAKKGVAYEAELSAMPTEELDALYKAELAAAYAEVEAKRQLEEKSRFFNWPTADADFDHWSKAAYWTLDEAVALAFGKDPRIVNWDALKAHVQISAFAGSYSALRDLTLRAQTTQQLYDPVIPGFFLGWAKRSDITYPPELEAKVVERGNHVGDWRSLYDDLKKVTDRQAEALKRTILQRDQTITELGNERDGLLSRLAEAVKPGRTESLGGKERESALKLIMGMAIGGYAYNPNAKRNDSTADIVSDLDRKGLHLDPDTVRKWLKEGRDLLPPESEEDRDP